MFQHDKGQYNGLVSLLGTPSNSRYEQTIKSNKKIKDK